jgi:hypothetical protein
MSEIIKHKQDIGLNVYEFLLRSKSFNWSVYVIGMLII